MADDQGCSLSAVSYNLMEACTLDLHRPVGLSGAAWQAALTSAAPARDLQGTVLV